MLQTDSTGNGPQLFVYNGADDHEDSTSIGSTTQEFLRAFEQLTGWQVETCSDSEVSKESENASSAREFRIVDMSPFWPARTPTANRSQCDRLVSLLGKLVNELEQARTMSNDSSIVTDGQFFREEQPLIDSFATGLSSTFSDSDFEVANRGYDDDSESVDQQVDLDEEVEFLDSSSDDHFELSEDRDSDFIVHQDISTAQVTLPDSWEKWSLGGASGFVSDTYLDWNCQTELLCVAVGKIDGRHGRDTESRIEIDPVNFRYRVIGDTSIPAFFTWDRRGAKTQPANLSGAWNPIYPGAAIICTTSPSIHTSESYEELNAESSADKMAEVFLAQTSRQEKLLVLKREV